MTQETTEPIIRMRISEDYSTKGVMTPGYTFEATGLGEDEYFERTEAFFARAREQHPPPEVVR